MKYFFLWMMAISPFLSSGQNHIVVDSLLKVADIEKSDSFRMIIFQKLGNYYLDNNAPKAIEFFEKVNGIAKELKLPLSVANSYYDLGFTYLVMTDYSKSLYNYQLSSTIYEELKDSFRLSNAYMSIGNLYFQNNDYGRVNEYYNKAELLVTKMKDSLQLGSIWDSRGINYDQAKKYDSALIWLKKAYAIERLASDGENYAVNSLSNIGLTYKHLGRTEEALRAFDTVRIYFEKNNMSKDRFAALYNNIAATNAQAGKIQLAMDAFNRSILFSKETGASLIEMENYRNMADMFGGIKDFAQQADYLKKYYNLKDSIFSADNKNQLTELEANYQVQKKNTELVKKDAEVVKQKSQRNILIIVALAIFGILAVLAYSYGRIRKKNGLLHQQNVKINEQRNELQTLNQVKDRLFSIISHDLRNPLVTLRSYLSLSDSDSLAPELKEQFKLKTMDAVSHTGDMLDNLLAWANAQIRNTRVNIVPVNVYELVEDAVSHVQAQALQKQLTIRQQLQVAVIPGDADILSVALRNLITNAIKFSSDKTTIRIGAETMDNEVRLFVTDEGTGMSAEQIAAIFSNQNDSTKGTKGEKGSGLGLFLVRELLQKINARLEIESVEGKGSRFAIVV